MKNYVHKNQDELCEELIALTLELFSPVQKVKSKSQNALELLLSERQVQPLPDISLRQEKSEIDKAARQIILARIRKKSNGAAEI